MKNYVIYDNSGLVIRSGTTPELLDTVFIEPGQTIIEADRLYEIERAAVINGNIEEIPQKPGSTYQWNGSAWQDTRTQQQVLDQQWQKIRAERDQKLQATDWRVIRAVDQGVALEPTWTQYRQALRDITNQLDPFNIIWPTIPGN